VAESTVVSKKKPSNVGSLFSIIGVLYFILKACIVPGQASYEKRITNDCEQARHEKDLRNAPVFLQWMAGVEVDSLEEGLGDPHRHLYTRGILTSSYELYRENGTLAIRCSHGLFTLAGTMRCKGYSAE
jgi:hypothetical protein